MSERLSFARPNQFFSRAIEDADTPVCIHADNASAGSRQHRFGETTPAIDKIARSHDVVALGAQFLGHLVEGCAELGQVSFRPAHRYLNVQIAGEYKICDSN